MSTNNPDVLFTMPLIPDTVEYESMTVTQLAVQLKSLKNDLEVIGLLKTEIQKAYDHLSMGILPDRMDADDIQTLKIKDVGRLQVSSDIRCAVPAANREEMQQWLEDNGHGSMVGKTINSSTLKAFVKEMMKENKDYPSELLKISSYSRATVVKA